MKKIVITGMGAVTPIGIGVDEYWKNLLDGKSGIDKITSFVASSLRRYSVHDNIFIQCSVIF